MGGKKHFDALLELLDIERVAEKQENIKGLQRFPLIPVSQHNGNDEQAAFGVLSSLVGECVDLAADCIDRGDSGEAKWPGCLALASPFSGGWLLSAAGRRLPAFPPVFRSGAARTVANEDPNHDGIIT